MKKFLIFSFILIVSMGIMYSQSITVTSPHSSDTWAKGGTHNITWTKSGTMDANVKITLYNTAGTTLIEVMTMNTPNDGSYSWTIPGSVAVGNYVVRVKTVDNAVSDDSDVFAISAPEAAVINVTSPHSGDTWAKGGTHTITWTKSGTMDANVKITLYNMAGTTLIEVITMNTPNDGSYSWTIPGSVAVGNYVVRVKTVDNAVSDDSDVFAISDTPAESLITVTNPNSSDEWCKGDPYNITWTKSGSMDANVNISLYSMAGPITIIATPTTNDGIYNWTIPATQATGDYKVKIKTVDATVLAYSDIFKIKTCADGGLIDHRWDRLREKLEAMRWIEWRPPKWPWPGPWPGPGPEPDPWFRFEKIQEIFSKAKFRGQVKVELFKGGEKIGELGTFGSRFRRGDVLKKGPLTVMPRGITMKRISKMGRKMLKTGGGYNLKFTFANGAIIIIDNFELKEMKQLKQMR